MRRIAIGTDASTTSEGATGIAASYARRVIRNLRGDPVRTGEVATPSDEALLAGIAIGDPAAAGTFVRRHQGRVYGLAVTILHDRAAAEDVAQEAFVRVWRHAGSFDARRGDVVPWLLTITRNAAIDRLRREGRQATLASWEQSDEADPRLSDADSFVAGQANWVNGQVLRRLLQNLPPEQRQLIELAFYDGYTHSELAELLQLPLGTVKTRLRMGMQKLRTLWEESERR